MKYGRANCYCKVHHTPDELPDGIKQILWNLIALHSGFLTLPVYLQLSENRGEGSMLIPVQFKVSSKNLQLHSVIPSNAPHSIKKPGLV